MCSRIFPATEGQEPIVAVAVRGYALIYGSKRLSSSLPRCCSDFVRLIDGLGAPSLQQAHSGYSDLIPAGQE